MSEPLYIRCRIFLSKIDWELIRENFKAASRDHSPYVMDHRSKVVINLLSTVESSQIQSSQIQEINELSPLTEISRETEDGDMHTTMLLSIEQLILTILGISGNTLYVVAFSNYNNLLQKALIKVIGGMLGVSLLSSLYLIIEFYVISRRAERQTSLVSFRSP